MKSSPFKKQSRLGSFGAAFRGLKILFLNEKNFRIHSVFALLAVAACAFLQVTATEWLIVLILIALVLSAEAINTCFEYLCDLVSPGYHPLVARIKDIAAGMVLFMAIIAVITGCIIFIPYIWLLV